MVKPQTIVELSSSLSSSNPKDLPKILISSPGYESKEIIPYKGDGTAKTDLGVISLTSTNVALKQDKIKASQQTLDQIKKLSQNRKDFNYLTQEKIIKKINELKSVVIPLLLTQIAQFGITKATELINKNKDEIQKKLLNLKVCPSNPNIEKIIQIKNKLVKILKNILNIIDKATIALGIAEGLIIIIQTSYNTLKNLPIPSSTGVSGVPGIPISTINTIQDTKDKFQKRIELIKKVNESLLSLLVLLKSNLELVLKLLNLLDTLIGSCIKESNQTEPTEQTNLLLNLQNLVIEQSNQLSPVTININGFTMGVEIESQTSTLSIKRRRAIATNKQGVIMLKGEWSFSSIDQILIDELVFYIQQNDLKAD